MSEALSILGEALVTIFLVGAVVGGVIAVHIVNRSKRNDDAR